MQVNIFVEDGEKLGLMIRGGAEYGLGIFIAGVDRDCAAEYAGLKVSSHCKIIVIFRFICGFIIYINDYQLIVILMEMGIPVSSSIVLF